MVLREEPLILKEVPGSGVRHLGGLNTEMFEDDEIGEFVT